MVARASTDRGVSWPHAFSITRIGVKNPSKAASHLSLRLMVSQVFYPDDGRPSRQFQLGFLDKGTARDHGPQTRLPDRGFQTDAADRIVEVHAGFSAERRRNICKGASDTGRKQNADMTLALPRGT